MTCLGLCQAVAASIAFGVMKPAMIVLVWTRVRRAEVAFLALVARVLAGRYRGGGVRATAVGAGRASPGVVPAGGRLPLRFGWLMGMMPYVAAGYGSQLRTILEEPDMAALLHDVAQARRILGPVCRMLGVEILGVRAPAVPKAAAIRPKRARVRAVVDWGRIPLPRGVLAAARRQGHGRVPRGKGD